MIIDLSHVINNFTPAYPGTQPPKISNACTMEQDNFREKLISMYSHTGTHLDVPSHMEVNGKTIDDLALDHFVGSAFVVDISSFDFCTLSDLLDYEEAIDAVDFLLFYTGFEAHWGSLKYFGNYPSLTPEVSQWLLSKNLKGVGVDAISIDTIDTTDFVNHHTLLENDLIIVENLCNLKALIGQTFTLHAAPLPIGDGDGSPTRAYAICE